MVYAALSSIHPALFSQEGGVGFRKAPDSELANRRYARPFHTKSSSQLNPATLSQGEGPAETRIARWGRNSPARQFRTIGACQSKRDLISCFSLSTVS